MQAHLVILTHEIELNLISEYKPAGAVACSPCYCRFGSCCLTSVVSLLFLGEEHQHVGMVTHLNSSNSLGCVTYIDLHTEPFLKL